jgi:hypothetical protein
MRCNPFQPRTRICRAAHYADELVAEFFHLEARRALRTHHATRATPFRIQEETVTESMLVKVADRFDDVVSVETFDKGLESFVGADWFWILDFGQTLVPMLVQAKRTKEPWDGDQDWTVEVDLAQKSNLETTAKNWNVAARYCVYAPSWRNPHPCCCWCRPSFMMLPPPTDVPAATVPGNQKSVVRSDDLGVVLDMTAFTCFCCSVTDPEDAMAELNVTEESLKERSELESLLSRAREHESINGSAIIKMGGD